MRLRKRIKGRPGGVDETFMGREGSVLDLHEGETYGMTIDGVSYVLEGQPRPATSRGWGEIPHGRR
jgi:hypothetical protein